MTNYRIHLTSFLLIMAFVGSSIGILAQSNSAQMGQEYAKDHIIRKSFELQLSDRDVEAPIFTDAYQSKHNGVFHVYLKQAYEQIPVYNATMNLNMDKAGGLLSIHSQFVSQLAERVNTTQPSISPEKAVQSVAAHLALNIGEVKVLEENLNIPQKTIFKQNDFLRRDVVVSQVYYALEDKSVRLAWNVDVSIKEPFNSYEIQVDAIDGTILNKISKTHHCSFDHSGNHSATCTGNHNHSDLKEEATTLKSNSMMPPGDYSYNIFDFPIESPAHGGRSTVTTPWTIAGNAGTLGWHDDGNTLYDVTRGNNVWARHNVDASNYYSPLATSTTDFDYPFNATSTLAENQDAAITNLFYTNNMMHDVWYQYGFDEESGNFQNDNLQRGGVAGDYVIAGAQDLTGTNNALFDTPADGQNPEMQMFIWYYSEIVKLEIEAPSPDAGVYTASTALFGDRLPLAPGALTGELVLVESLDSLTDTTTNTMYSDTTNWGCTPFLNAAEVAGKIALIDRGGCLFLDKVREAQAAGAVACVVCNNEPGSPFVMSGDAPDITIPSLMVGQSVCDAIKANANAVNVSMYSTREELSYDASFDNGVVSHEYGHGISMRLTGGASNVACLGNSEQMGEGWSDWMGLWMTMEAGDTGAEGRGMGTYVNGEEPTGEGLRLKPYSTDFAVNDYTYDDLCNSEVLAPHGVGFIWGTMLWDLTWALVDEYGFDPDLYNGSGGNNLAAQLIIDGMKIQPCSPGFVDGRDAIILADDILTGGANYCLIWETFARRGLGYSTIQGSSFNRCDQVAAYDTPSFCTTYSMIKEIDMDEVSNGDVVTYTIAGINNTGSTLDNVVVTDTLSSDLTYVNNSSDCPVSVNGQILSYNVGSLNDEAGFQCSFQATVNSPNASQIEFFDGAENGMGTWDTTDMSGNGNNWFLSGLYPYEGFHSYRVLAPGSASDQVLTMKQPVQISGANPMLVFRHFYITELRWDFGRVEISTNGGTTWDDLGSKFISNGYNDVIDSDSNTGYANQAGFTGHSGGYLMSIADLSFYSGQSVLIRFRMITDDFLGDDGWLIDNITIADLVTLDNVACTSSDQVEDCAQASAIIAGELPDTEARLQVKAFLQGGLNNSNNIEMHSTLSDLGLVPQLEPYTALPAFQHFGDGGGETISNSMLGIVGNNGSIVDWVMIELRSKVDGMTVVATQSVLLTQNGTIIDGAGDNVLRFDVPNDDYYVAIRHRNHLGLMTANPVYISDNGSGGVPLVDFSNPVLDCYGNDDGYITGGARALWAGNVKQEGNMIFQGMNNVPNEIFFKILTDPGNTAGLLNYIMIGYDINDLNLDGQVIYQGVNNDPNIPFFNVLLNTNNPQSFSNFVVEEQLPENQ